jgi:hypothetical protein
MVQTKTSGATLLLRARRQFLVGDAFGGRLRLGGSTRRPRVRSIVDESGRCPAPSLFASRHGSSPPAARRAATVAPSAV